MPPLTVCGKQVRLEAWDSQAHTEGLWRIAGGAQNADLWTYMSGGPFLDRQEFQIAINQSTPPENPEFFAIIDNAAGQVSGRIALLNVRAEHRVGEVGHVLYSHSLQRTRGATEAQYLLAGLAFEQRGFRRYEWKCNALNVKSRSAAERLGFQFEGIFRQHMLVKGQNRDTAWFSLLDSEWPAAKQALENWLADSNFDSAGNQLMSLAGWRDSARSR